MAPAWTKNCENQKYLESLFQSGEVTLEDKPKEIYGKYSCFGVHSLDVFCNTFNKVKKAFLNNTKPLCMKQLLPPNKKRGKYYKFVH